MVWVLLAIAACFGLAAFVSRLTNFNLQVPPRIAMSVLAGTTALGIGSSCVYLILTGARPNRPPHFPEVSSTGAPATASQPLALGLVAPEFKVQGWVNQEPPATNSKFTVLDVWGGWCPVCDEAAPGLVELYRDYEQRGVAFISVAADSQESVTTFVQNFKIPWSNGYGMSRDTLATLGASNGGPAMAGYEAIPTLYLLDADRRVLWCDQQQRYHHNNVSALIQELRQEIDKALSATTE